MRLLIRFVNAYTQVLPKAIACSCLEHEHNSDCITKVQKMGAVGNSRYIIEDLTTNEKWKNSINTQNLWPESKCRSHILRKRKQQTTCQSDYAPSSWYQYQYQDYRNTWYMLEYIDGEKMMSFQIFIANWILIRRSSINLTQRNSVSLIIVSWDWDRIVLTVTFELKEPLSILIFM